MPLEQELLGAGIGADLLAPLAVAAWGGAIGDHRGATALAEVPGPGDAALHLPDPVPAPAGTVFRVQILLGIAAAQVLPIRECLTVLHQRQVDVDIRDHLGNRTAVAIGGLDLEPDLAPDRQPLLQVAASLLAVGALGGLRGIDAGQPYGHRAAGLTDADGVAIADREHGGAQALLLSQACLHAQPTQAQHPDS